MIYFAYGSNLDLKRISARCPSVKVLGEATLRDYRLVFQENNGGRIVANIEPCEGHIVYGVLYDIEDEADIETLDRCEGNPVVYKRTKVVVYHKKRKRRCETYIMSPNRVVTVRDKQYLIKRKYGEPREDYYQYIFIGYFNFKLPLESLRHAREYSKLLGFGKTL